MSRPAISSIKLSKTLTISECHRDSDRPQGFWIYDETQGMNLAMGEPDRDKAFTEALTYYQKRLMEVEYEYRKLTEKVEGFINQFKNDDDNDDD